jgi:hypothetical protein
MRAVGKKTGETRFGFGNRIGRGNADGVEPAGLRSVAEGGLQRGWIAQKSRSA